MLHHEFHRVTVELIILLGTAITTGCITPILTTRIESTTIMIDERGFVPIHKE